MKTYDLALVGCGGVSRMHLEGYRRHPDRLRVVAVCDPDAERLEKWRQEYGIERGFPSLDAMMEGAEWDVAVVCTPTSVRESVFQTLASAGKPIFVEKPLADTFEEACRIVEAGRTHGVPLAVDQNFRYHYPFDTARQILREGRLGKVHMVLHQDLMFRQDRGWRVEQPRHALSVMGIHWLDGFRWMLNAEATSITCRTYSSPAVHCRGETDAHAQIAFENGAGVQLIESFSSPFSRTETVVIGDGGVLVLSYEGALLYDPENRKEPRERWGNPYRGGDKPESAYCCLDELLTAVEEGREPANSGGDNLKTVALLEGAYCSAERGQAIPFRPGGLL